MKIVIPRCYDSHVHIKETGELLSALKLFDLRSPFQVKDLSVLPQHFRGDWLVGFGWDDTKWESKSFPDRNVLDQYFPNHPVAFSRRDGHALWVNTTALKKAGLFVPKEGMGFQNFLPSEIQFGQDGYPNGILLEGARNPIEKLLPAWTDVQTKDFILRGLDLFWKRGFTHLREMMASRRIWEIYCQLEESQELKSFIDVNFHISTVGELEDYLNWIKTERQKPRRHLRPLGIKIFIDGALGSEGALLSRNYSGSNKSGIQLWQLDEIEKVFDGCMRAGIELAVHVIGDHASHLIADVAKRRLLKGSWKPGFLLNLEHCELMSTEDIVSLSGLPVICHLQPCHWLSDRHWLDQKLGGLARLAFPWARLEKHKVEFRFGSDSPIEEPSLISNFQALQLSQDMGIAPITGKFEDYHSHPDETWGKGYFTEMEDTGETRVMFIEN